MECMHKYVPLTQYAKDETIPGSSDHETVVTQAVDFHRILFGGDQLTAKRGRGAQRIRVNLTNNLDKLKGLQPVSEDWHTKQCFLAVSGICMKYAYTVVPRRYAHLVITPQPTFWAKSPV